MPVQFPKPTASGSLGSFADALLSRIEVPKLITPDMSPVEYARQDLGAFAKLMDPNYQDVAHARLVREQLELAERKEIRRLIVTMPPRHGKSRHCSEFFPAWLLGRDPSREIVIASHTDQLAEAKSRIVQNMLRSPMWPWPLVTLDFKTRGVQRWMTTDGGQLLACGVRGSPVGFGADFLVIDDYHRHRQDADSPTIRDTVWTFWQEGGLTRLSPDGVVVILATRWHEDDLIGRLLNSQGAAGWTVIELSAIYDDPNRVDPLGRSLGEALWPERWPVEALPSVEKGEIDRRAWEAEYQQRPTALEGNLFHREWWQRYDLEVMKARGLKPRLITVDSAFKTGVANDFSVAAVWGFMDNRAYLMDLWRARVEFNDLEDALRGMWEKWHVPIYVEDKASGQSVIQTLRRAVPATEFSARKPPTPIMAWRGPKGSNSRSRADEVTKWVAAQVVYVPWEPWANDFIEEHANYPAAPHDDQVDTTSMALITLFSGQERPIPGKFGYNPQETTGQRRVGRWLVRQREARRQLAEERMRKALEEAGLEY
jgi:predicted phage terminase large subunit-like protein